MKSYIAALGGKANIVRVDTCAETRLRLVLRNELLVKDADLRAQGITAIARPDWNVMHLLASLNANQYAAEMRAQLAA